MNIKLKEKHVRKESHHFCPGCGHTVFLNSFVKTLDKIIEIRRYDPNNICLFSGIGCASLVAQKLNHDTVQSIHGRALSTLTGAKLSNPKLEAIVISGEGDLAGIGGNHLKETIRRDISIKCFCLDNSNYGMTGGHVSVTSKKGSITKSTPFGSKYEPLDLGKFVTGCGGKHFTTCRINSKKSIEDMELKIYDMLMAKEGFYFMDVKSYCPAHYGKYNPSIKKETS